MKYALIGCGRISTNHVKAVVNNKLEFVAACDVVPEHIENVLAKHGLENDTSIKRYTDYKKMIEENEIELVGIATESGLHAEIALYCIEHGINCIIEKPMAMSIEDADKIIKLSEEKGVLDLSESTLYPVLRRLQKDGCLTVHDEAFNGRNRRYYQITPAGRAQLAGYRAEWDAYTAKIDRLFEGETQ